MAIAPVTGTQVISRYGLESLWIVVFPCLAAAAVLSRMSRTTARAESTRASARISYAFLRTAAMRPLWILYAIAVFRSLVHAACVSFISILGHERMWDISKIGWVLSAYLIAAHIGAAGRRLSRRSRGSPQASGIVLCTLDRFLHCLLLFVRAPLAGLFSVCRIHLRPRRHHQYRAGAAHPAATRQHGHRTGDGICLGRIRPDASGHRSACRYHLHGVRACLRLSHSDPFRGTCSGPARGVGSAKRLNPSHSSIVIIVAPPDRRNLQAEIPSITKRRENKGDSKLQDADSSQPGEPDIEP